MNLFSLNDRNKSCSDPR